MTLHSAAEVQAIIRRNVGVATQPHFEVDAVGAHHADVRLPYAEGMTRLGDTVSGPVLMTAADAAMYAVILAHVPEGEYAVTSHFQIDFLRRPRAADILARAHILRCGWRSVNCRVELFSGDFDSLVAHVTGAYARMASATSGASPASPPG